MINRKMIVVALVLALSAGVSLACAKPPDAPALPAAQPATTGPQNAPTPAGPICAAVIEPEVLADLPQAQRNALAGSLDTLLTESLAKQSGFLLVDRQALDKVLEEKALTAAGLARIAPGQLAAPLRPFWAAGVLVCATIRQDGKESGTLLVHIEAVAAQTGQLLAEQFETGTWKKSQWVEPLLPEKTLESFWRDIRKGIADGAGLPLVEIADGRLISELSRGQWMVDDLADVLRAQTAADQRCVLLVPRRPASTKEERLLRLMGLSARKAGDAAAELAPVPDARLTFDLEEQIAEGLAVEKTPLVLKLIWSAGAAKAVSWSAQGAIGQWDGLRANTAAWVRGRRAELSGRAPAADGEQSARQMAQRELELVHRWQGLRFSFSPDSPLEVQRRYRLVTHALRAAHLDPESKEAAYNVALHIDALYAVDDRQGSQQCHDRIIAECRRYLDRFGRQTKEKPRQKITSRMALAAVTCETVHARRRRLALSSRQDLELYPYAVIYVPAWLERDAADAALASPTNPNLGNLWASSWMLRLDLVMNCPAGQLDEEHVRWRQFWRNRVEKIAGNVPPWDLIEVFFQIRSNDWHKVREAYQRLAGKYDLAARQIWYYGDVPLLPHTLRAARDPQWSTWQPVFARGLAREIRQQDFGFARGMLSPAFLDSWPNGPCLPVSKMILPKENGANIAWGAMPAQILAVIDGQMWGVSPGVDRLNPTPSQLWRAGVPDEPAEARKPLGQEHWLTPKAVPVEISPKTVPWPKWNGQGVEPSVTCALLSQRNDQAELLLGTSAHGIARFTRKDGGWTGRWITAREGMPVENIEALAACQIDGQELWVASGLDAQKSRKLPGGETYLGNDVLLWTIDPTSGTIRILFRGGYDKLRAEWNVAIVRRAYCATHLSAEVMAHLNVEQVNVEDIFALQGQLVLSGKRLWRVQDSVLTELSPQTLRPIAKPIGDTPPWYDLPNISAAGICRFGSLYCGSGRRVPTYDWPGIQLRGAVGWQGQIAMIVGPESVETLAFYRPAPSGSGDWASQDQWAFYATPEKCVIRSLYADAQGALWLATTAGLLRLNATELSSLATIWSSKSTQQWRHDWWKTSGHVWEREVAAHIARKQWEQALQRIAQYDLELSHWTMNDKLKWARLAIPFWRARVYAEQPGMAGKAVEMYAALAVNREAPDAARLLARICQMLVLHQAQQWQDLVTVYHEATIEFPQLKAVNIGSDTLAPLVEEARQKCPIPPVARPKT